MTRTTLDSAGTPEKTSLQGTNSKRDLVIRPSKIVLPVNALKEACVKSHSVVSPKEARDLPSVNCSTRQGRKYSRRLIGGSRDRRGVRLDVEARLRSRAVNSMHDIYLQVNNPARFRPVGSPQPPPSSSLSVRPLIMDHILDSSTFFARQFSRSGKAV